LDAVGLKWSKAQAIATLGLVETDLGRYEDARRHFEQALALSRETDSKWHIGFGLYCLGYLALAEEKHVKAQQHQQESAAIFRACGQQSTVGWPLALLGAAESKLGQSAQARAHLRETLCLSREMLDGVTPLLALPAAALLFASLGQAERAVELYALASRYGVVANSRMWEDVAGREIAALAETLPPEVAAAAQERGRGRELWTTVEELLHALSEAERE
jgi:tetratricopeptide (TPR) repeat protein